MTVKSTTNLLIPVKQFRNKISIGERGLRQLVERGKIKEIDFDFIKDNGAGRPALAINPMALPEPYRSEWIEANEQQQVNGYTGTLPDWAFERAVARIDVVRFLKQEKGRAQSEGRRVSTAYDEAAELFSTGHILSKAFEVLGSVSGYTLKNWEKTYDDARAYGNNVIEALAPAHGHRRGASKIPDWYSKLILEGLLTPNRKNVTRVCKEVNAELRLQSKEIPCSIKTMQRFIKKWKSSNLDTWVLMREGKKALNDKVMPYIDRDWNLLEVGDILIADGHVLNFDVKHPLTGKAHRPTLIVFLDGRSRYPVGISIMPTENIDNINEALLDSIRTLGKFPKSVILDNGRAFKAKHFTQSPDFYDAGISGIYERYGIITHFTAPYHGQSKPVEPWFNQFNERFSKNMATYRGASIDTKVPRLLRNEKWHQQWHKKVVGDYLPTISEVIELIKFWASEIYGKEKHSGLHIDETPLRLVEHGRGPGVDPALLLDLMFKSRAVTPKRARFTLEGIQYGNADVLTGVQRRLLVRYTRTIEDKVWVFDPETNPPELMCVAEAIEAVHPLERLTDEAGEFRPGYRAQLDQRKKLERKAHKTAKALAEMNANRGMEHSGIGIPKDLPDATPIRIDTIEAGPLELPEENGPRVFDAAYERFEYLAKERGFKDLTDPEIDFLKDFMESGTYTGLYKQNYDEQLSSILNNHQ